jgi:Kdo2-lipid IVA lauroyltransferase/acyltransferase
MPGTAAGLLTISKNDKINIMNRIIPGLTWLIIWTFSWLPGFMLKFISYLINFFVSKGFQYRKQVVERNLGNSFPTTSKQERLLISEKFYQHFAELFMELLLLVRLNPKKLSKRLRLTNPKIINSTLAQGKNIIVMCGHFGNWEWNVPQLLATGYRVLAVYKPQSSYFADQLMHKIRHKPGLTLVPMKDTLRVVANEIKQNKKPFALLLVADQTPARCDIRFWAKFLNQDTAFFTGAEKLSILFRMPVLYIDQDKSSFGHYNTTLTLINDGIDPGSKGEITRMFASLLEKSIQKSPHLWLWTHRRWKYERDDIPLSS